MLKLSTLALIGAIALPGIGSASTFTPKMTTFTLSGTMQVVGPGVDYPACAFAFYGNVNNQNVATITSGHFCSPNVIAANFPWQMTAVIKDRGKMQMSAVINGFPCGVQWYDIRMPLGQATIGSVAKLGCIVGAGSGTTFPAIRIKP